MSPKRPTLRDVAREAGLSVTQTSRALNGHDDVAVATRRRAAEVADRLGYAPNLQARRLKNPDSRVHSIGLVLDTSQRFSDPFLGDLLTAMVDEATTSDHELQLSAPVADDPIHCYAKAIRNRQVDGFILLRVANDDERVTYLLDQGVAFVAFGPVNLSEPAARPIPYVGESDECIQPAVDHLVELGHRRIGCVHLPLGYGISDHRLDSFHRSVAAHGLEAEPHHVTGAGFHEALGYQVVSEMLETGDGPTAIIAFNDLLAFGAMRAAADQGLSVPGDLSIIGFDDVMAARFLSPALTSLRSPADRIGRKLVRQLIELVNQGDTPSVTFETELVVRDSTATPA